MFVWTRPPGCAGDAERGLLHSQHRDEHHGRPLRGLFVRCSWSPALPCPVTFSAGGVQEMLGLASFMAHAAMSEVSGYFKEAFSRYTSPGSGEQHRASEHVRLATRSMVLLADYARQHGLHAEANYALMKAHFQVSSAAPQGPLLHSQHCCLGQYMLQASRLLLARAACTR